LDRKEKNNGCLLIRAKKIAYQAKEPKKPLLAIIAVLNNKFGNDFSA